MTDDDPDDRKLMGLLWPEFCLDYQLDFAKDGEELMSSLTNCISIQQKEALPDIILLDLNMPKKDGRVVLKEIKENPQLKHIDVIIFTTSSYEEDKKYCLANGANDYLIKPFQLMEWEEVIKKVCKTDKK